MKKIISAIILLCVACVALFALNSDIEQKKGVKEFVGSADVVKLGDNNPDFAYWGKNFPDYLDMYLQMKDSRYTATNYAGSWPYSKINRFPQLTMFWDGYAFKFDYNMSSSHYYSQIDQMKTLRNNKKFLNAHGLKKFGGQPGACMNCHTGNLQNLVKEYGWVPFNTMKYWTIVKLMKLPDNIHGKQLGSTCADCHRPDDMSLRITRPAAINALISRGYKADKLHGVQASRQEMRTLVCTQCHVEYYFKPVGHKVKIKAQSKYAEGMDLSPNNKIIEIEKPGIELTFPWSKWPKGEPFRIEMFDDYYASVNDVFKKDFTHAATKAPILKMQHPEAELYSGGVHAANGVSCADCHMPYVRHGARKVTDHTLMSPLNNVNNACKSCHAQDESYLKEQVFQIQSTTAYDIRTAEYAVASLIKDITTLRNDLASLPEFANISDAKAREAAITKAIMPVLLMHRKAQMRADFLNAENSSGFHNPREAARIALQAVDYAKQGQDMVQQYAQKYSLHITPSKLGFKDMRAIAPQPVMIDGKRYYEEPIQADAPAGVLELDKNNAPYNYQYIFDRSKKQNTDLFIYAPGHAGGK